ncbi:MAG: hypothetical protein B7Z47_00965, partial [Chthoniobacter sp. 12-60-6]
DVRLESGGARFGNTFDDWGNRFLCNIRNPCQHVVLPYRYLARNPYLVVPSALNDCAEAGDQLPVYRTSPPEPWREFRAKRWVQEGSTLPKSELVGAGVVTSSAGITVYRGDAYPPEYRDFVFVADVAGNLFYRMKLVPDGVTFKAVQVDGTKNFCTSDDLWCRPVNFVNAPDGCLHVCDMYREVIEHPWSIPDDIHTAVDLLRGRDQGRLYRLAPKSFNSRHTPKLSAVTTAELVALLDHPNAWHRETAQRLLFERRDAKAVGTLASLVKNGRTPQGKIGALAALMKPDAPSLIAGLQDPNEHVRAHALHVTYTGSSYDDGVLEAMPDAGTETSPVVLFQIALWPDQTLSTLSDEDRNEAVARQLADPWTRTAALSDPWMWARAWDLLARLPDSEPLAEYMGEAGKITGLVLEEQHTPELLEEIAWKWPEKPLAARRAFAGWLDAAARKEGDWRLFHLDPTAREGLSKLIVRSVEESLQTKLPLPHRLESIKLIRGLPLAESLTPLSALLGTSQASEVQFAALEVLGSFKEPQVADQLLRAWPSLTPTLRDKAATLLLSRTDRIAKLLDAIEAKKVLPSQLSAASKATLSRQKTPALAERITKLIGDGSSSNRKAVIDKYTAALSGSDVGTPARNSAPIPGSSPRMTGDTTRGAKIYETLCMVCHRHLDRGNDVGPNLGTIKAWTAEQILTNVLDPNREVSPNFALYIVETNDGRTLSGLITSETAGNLTLKRADGGTDTVLRSEIKSLTSPGISLMPEGLEAAITPQQMADLIAYLKAP